MEREEGWRNAWRLSARVSARRAGRTSPRRSTSGGAKTEAEAKDSNPSTSRASEAQLLEELNRRRRERVRKTGGAGGAATSTNDVELDADLTEKQMFCTAEGCRREP